MDESILDYLIQSEHLNSLNLNAWLTLLIQTLIFFRQKLLLCSCRNLFFIAQIISFNELNCWSSFKSNRGGESLQNPQNCISQDNLLLHAYPLPGTSRRIGKIFKPFSLPTLTLCGLILICQDITDTQGSLPTIWGRKIPPVFPDVLAYTVFPTDIFSNSSRFISSSSLPLGFSLGARGHFMMIHCERALVKVCSDRCHDRPTIVIRRTPVY